VIHIEIVALCVCAFVSKPGYGISSLRSVHFPAKGDLGPGAMIE
jgi:hypothetical protein